ncbi:MAG: type II secretion system minor pseudopilin GspK [Desulfobulbaceae bacterium]|nr:type II secretion system minor pseudopilin GspK [Desulfobulbaceae bacterium]
MILRNHSGMALVLALLAISFLVAITVQLSGTVNWQVKASTNLRDSVSIDAMNRSALNIARASLLADMNINDYDSQHDDWQILPEKDLHLLLDSDNLTISVTDLSGKVQVNAFVSQEKDAGKRAQQEQAQYNLWLRLLTSGRFAIADEQEAIALLDSIIDWIDSNDDERDHGAEAGYYLSREPPYEPRNAPVQNLEELLLIRGMTDDIFYGNDEYSGIRDYLTIYGTDGKININTAPAPVLQALADDLDETMVLRLVEFRQDEGNREALADPMWYKLVSGFPGDIELGTNLITVKSYYFHIASTVEKRDLARTGSAVVYRDKSGAQNLLRWDIE